MCLSSERNTILFTSLVLVPESLGGLGLRACFLPAPAYPHGDPQHMVIFVQLAQGWVFSLP